MPAPHGLAAFVGGAVLALLAGCATEDALGPEFLEVKAAESELAFNHDSVAGGYSRFFKGRDRVRGHTIHTGDFRPARSEYPSLQLNLLNAPPGYYFGHADLDDGLIQGWSNFQNRSVNVEAAETVVGPLGRFATQRFRAENQSCAVFAVLFGNRDYGAGTRRLDGIYCLAPGAALSQSELEAVIRGVSVKG